jgi:hypothetical protein
MQLSRGRSQYAGWYLVLVVVSLVFCFCVLPSNASPDHLLPQTRSHVDEMMRPPELEKQNSMRVPGQRVGRKTKSNKGTSNKTKGKKVKKAQKENKEAKQVKHKVAKCMHGCEIEFEEESAPVQEMVSDNYFDSFFEETMMEMSMPTQVRQEKSSIQSVTTIKHTVVSSHDS